ncbi:hypothetical protein EMCRGX_G020822 [Ephydatia muelleri]
MSLGTRLQSHGHQGFEPSRDDTGRGEQSGVLYNIQSDRGLASLSSILFTVTLLHPIHQRNTLQSHAPSFLNIRDMPYTFLPTYTRSCTLLLFCKVSLSEKLQFINKYLATLDHIVAPSLSDEW